jgi:hypothetical protein
MGMEEQDMSSQNVVMAKKRTKIEEPKDVAERKPYRWARVRDRLAQQLDKVVATNASDFTEEVNVAVREYLEKKGLWPMEAE